MKKLTGMLLACAMLVGLMAGCSATPAATTTTTAAKDAAGATTTAAEAETTAAEAQGLTENIVVISREDGSGTRGAFIELMGVEVKDASGNKVDHTTIAASITNSTSVMMTTVAGDPYAIGYISLGSLNDTVKALQIDSVSATAANVKNGTYPVARPFNIVTTGEISPQAQDFIRFILSAEGQQVVEKAGYISQGNTGTYQGGQQSGKIVVAGSSSVTPAMEKLKEAYAALNPDVTIEIQQSDSTTGVTSAIDGVCDIGMASRELKDSELEKGASPTVIAMDGIAVVVNPQNPLSGLTSEQVRTIFTGEVNRWSGVTA